MYNIDEHILKNKNAYIACWRKDLNHAYTALNTTHSTFLKEYYQKRVDHLIAAINELKES